MLVASGGITVGIGEAGEQLLFGDGVEGVLTAAGEIGDGGGINDGDVVGSGECDDERAGARCTVVVGDLIVDGDLLGVTSSEALTSVSAGMSLTEASWKELVAAVEAMPSVTL